MPWNKTDKSFKTLLGRRTTDAEPSKYWYNEKSDFTLDIHHLEIKTDAIPGTPPGADTAVIDVYAYASRLTLIEDTSVPGKMTWFASSNSDTESAQTDEASRLKDWIPEKYGAGYLITLYDTSDVQIPYSDASGWHFDYPTGILTFANVNTDSGSVISRAPYKIVGYRYIGNKGTAKVTGGGTGTSTAFTQGSIVFAGASGVYAQDNSNFFWDDSNNTLGIGTTRTGAISGTNPRFRILGSGTTSSTSSFEVRDSLSASLFLIRDDGLINLGTKGTYTESTGRIALSATGSTGGLLIGGDANLYRSAADVLATDDHFNLNTSNREIRFTTSNTSSGGVLFNTSHRISAYQDQGFVFTTPISGTVAATINGGSFRREVDVSGAFTGSLNGLTISSQFNDGFTSGSTSTGNVNGAYVETNVSSFAGTGGTLANLTGIKINSIHYDDSFSGSGISVVNQFGADISVTNSSNGGIVTNSTGVWVANTSDYTANGQTRYGIFIDSMPDPSSFTGTTTAAIRLTGTGGVRDGILFGSDTNLYRSTSNTLRTDDAFIAGNGLTVSANGAGITGAITGTTSLTLGATSGTTGSILLRGVTSGTITIQPQAAAGTYNFNLPTTAGTTGYILTSAGGAGSPMTWTDPSSLGGSTWNALTNPNGNESLSMTTYTTVFNWATGTSTNNLFSLTTDSSADGTGVLLNVNTGASSTVIPFKVSRSSTDYFTVNATGGVLVGNLTSSRITYAGTSGLLSDSSAMTFDGSRIALSTTGSAGGLLIGGDANLYRSAADVLKTDDAFEALSFNKVAITAPATSATLTIADGATLTVSASATISNGTHSGTNTGDNAVNSLYSGLVSNATHTGEVTGATTLTVDKTAITNKSNVSAAASDKILIADASDSDNLKHVTAQSIVDLVPYIRRSVNVVSTPTTAGAVANTDYVYLVSGTTTITLPTAVGNTNMYTVKRTGTNTVTVDTTSSQTIDGLTSQTLLTQYESMDFISDNANWSII